MRIDIWLENLKEISLRKTRRKWECLTEKITKC